MPVVRATVPSEADVREAFRRTYAMMHKKRQELMGVMWQLPAILAAKPKPDRAQWDSYTDAVRHAAQEVHVLAWCCQVMQRMEKLGHEMQEAPNGSR